MEILGLLDTLESIILDGTKIPFTKKLIVDEEKVLNIIDKVRLVVQGGGGFAKEALASRMVAKAEARETRDDSNLSTPAELEGKTREEAKAVEVLQQAYQMAKEIREGADKYADEILANLEATSTRILRTLKAGRDRLTKTAPAGENK